MISFGAEHTDHLYNSTPATSPNMQHSINGTANHNEATTNHYSTPHSPINTSFKQSIKQSVDRYFQITARQSTIQTEIRAGLVTFATMAYIIIVNASILSLARAPSDSEAPRVEGLITATALSALVGCLIVGMIANLPIGLAAGMGLNAALTYNVVINQAISWRIGLTCVFVHGLIFCVLSLTGLCNMLQIYAPQSIKQSITVGLGLFQALIGWESMKLVVQGKGVLLSIGELDDPIVIIGFCGLLLMGCLLVWRVPASMLIGMLVLTLLCWITGVAEWPTHVIQTPGLGNTFLALDFGGFFSEWRKTFPVVGMFLFVSISDTAGVQLMAGEQANLIDDQGHLPGSTAAFFAAGFATVVGSLFGCSPVIIHTESCAGIADGARTGLSSTVVAILFGFSLFFAPVVACVPPVVTAPVLVLVGLAMMAPAQHIDWTKVEQAVPAFLTLTLLPFSYSIANGVVAGLIAYAVLNASKRLQSGWESISMPLSRAANYDLITRSPLTHRRHSIIAESPSFLPVFGATPVNGLHPHFHGQQTRVLLDKLDLSGGHGYGSVPDEDTHF